MTLTDELSTDPARLADGETVTRRVTLRAKGTLPEALPPRPIVSEPWLITFAAPVERQLLPDRGRAGLRGDLGLAVPPRDRRARRAAADRHPLLQRHHPRGWTRSRSRPLPIGYASFYTSQVQTGRFDAAGRLAEAGALLAGLAAGGALVLSRRAPDTTRARLAAPPPPLSPLLRWRLRRAARDGDLLAARRLLAETRPEATEAAALLDAAIYGHGTGFDPAAFRRALRRA